MEELKATLYNTVGLIQIADVVDVLIMTFLLYYVFTLLRETSAGQVIKAIVFIIVFAQVTKWLNLYVTNFVFDLMIQIGGIALVVVFQPELRRALEHAGYSRFTRNLFRFGKTDDEIVKRWEVTIEAACSAAELLQKQRMGALMVFERDVRLGDIIDTGTALGAAASPELIGNIFFNKAPLHDGAMILRDGKICAAGCILPLTDNLELSSELGTRHRAAVGMSENSDAVVVVVSEETGTISVARGGNLLRGFDRNSLHELLERELLSSRETEEPVSFFEKIKQRREKK